MLDKNHTKIGGCVAQCMLRSRYCLYFLLWLTTYPLGSFKAVPLNYLLHSLSGENPKYRSKGPREGKCLLIHFTYPLLDQFQILNIGEM
jgi:hypothetical protein